MGERGAAGGGYSPKYPSIKNAALHEYFFMIKLTLREMKNLSRILTALLCIAPMFNASVAAPVATTSGSNLTSFNPSNANNNQWATTTNARYDTNTTAKSDFGNCNAVILRCAQPKCGNGGCTDYSIAGPIVEGCVKSNAKCKKFGDDLINSMTAQLVANSNAKLNEQQAAIEMAKAQAEAQAAASAAAANAQTQQMEMMQQQMAQMQQQMAQQQAESAAQLQAALAEQAAQSQQALESMRSAATEAAQQTEAGISSYQQEAIERGISKDVLERQKISGQIFTQIQDAEVLLQSMKKSMQNAFEYAGCDARGNNCSGPKRITKWRELAKDFFEPYDGAIDKIYDALITAQTVGINLSQVYMMLNDSCNQWGQYMCAKNDATDIILYPENTKPYICQGPGSDVETRKTTCVAKKECTLLKTLTSDDEVYEGWIEPEETSSNKVTVVACASGALNSTKIFARRTKNKNGAGLVDIDALEIWMNQIEPNKKYGNEPDPHKYCSLEDREGMKTKLQTAVLSRSVSGKKDTPLCVNKIADGTEVKEEDCAYINPLYAICNTHFFNAGYADVETAKTKDAEKEAVSADFTSETKEIIGLKITAISQQMYKQYEYIKATLRRIQIQLEKAVLSANLEAAGAESEDGGSSSSGGLARGSSKNSNYKNCSGKDGQQTLYCVRDNYSVLEDQVKNCKKATKEQLYKDFTILNDLLDTDVEDKGVCGTKATGATKCEECLNKISAALIQLERQNKKDEADIYRRPY